MATTYPYSYSDTLFPNGVSLDSLTTQVNNTIVPNTLQYINYFNGTVTFYFSSALADQTVLDNIVSASTIIKQIGSYNLSLSINDDPYTDSVYTLVGTIQGATYLNNMTNIIVSSNIISGTGSYTLRFYNVSTRNEIAKATFSNTDPTSNDLGTIGTTNITSSSILELHCLVTGSCSVNITNLSIYYNQ